MGQQQQQQQQRPEGGDGKEEKAPKPKVAPKPKWAPKPEVAHIDGGAIEGEEELRLSFVGVRGGGVGGASGVGVGGDGVETVMEEDWKTFSPPVFFSTDLSLSEGDEKIARRILGSPPATPPTTPSTTPPPSSDPSAPSAPSASTYPIASEDQTQVLVKEILTESNRLSATEERSSSHRQQQEIILKEEESVGSATTMKGFIQERPGSGNKIMTVLSDGITISAPMDPPPSSSSSSTTPPVVPDTLPP